MAAYTQRPGSVADRDGHIGLHGPGAQRADLDAGWDD